MGKVPRIQSRVEDYLFYHCDKREELKIRYKIGSYRAEREIEGIK